MCSLPSGRVVLPRLILGGGLGGLVWKEWPLKALKSALFSFSLRGFMGRLLMVGGGLQALVYSTLRVEDLLVSEPCWAIGLSSRSGPSGPAGISRPPLGSG